MTMTILDMLILMGAVLVSVSMGFLSAVAVGYGMRRFAGRFSAMGIIFPIYAVWKETSALAVCVVLAMAFWGNMRWEELYTYALCLGVGLVPIALLIVYPLRVLVASCHEH